MQIKNRIIFSVLSGIFFIGIIITSCRHKAVIPPTPAISFSKDVSPIIVGNCAQSGCHASNTHRAITNYSQVMNFVTPGNAYQSQLYQDITKLGSGKMPPNQPLSEEQLILIYVWIQQGAQNN